MPLWTDMLREFVTLFVVIDPIGTLPVFLFAAQGVPRGLHRRLALRAAIVAAAVLLSFLLLGQLVLEALGLRLGAFQIAGGLILFLFSLTMIFGQGKPDTEIHEAEAHARDDASASGSDHTLGILPGPGSRQRPDLSAAVFPLAMPSIASPGAMLAIVILTDNHSQSVAEQAVTAGLLLVVLVLTLAIMLGAARLHRLIGNTGASVVSRVMGMILATVAVDAVLGGFDTLGLLSLPPEPVL